MMNLSNPIKGEWKGRGFGRRYVWTYECQKCGRIYNVRAGSFRGRTPVPGIGGMYCDCDVEKTSNANT